MSIEYSQSLSSSKGALVLRGTRQNSNSMPKKPRIWKTVLALSFGFVTALTTATAFADPKAGSVKTITLFDAKAPDTPESVVIDKSGNFYVGMALTGEIRKIGPEGTQSTLAKLPIGTGKTDLGFPAAVGGLAFDATEESIYVNVVSTQDKNKGVWKVSLSTGENKLVVPLPPTAFPNGLALQGDKLFVADSQMDVVWRLDPAAGKAEVWLDHPLLKRDPKIMAPGPNGIKIFQNVVYVANSNSGGIIAASIGSDGKPANVHLHSQMAQGIGCDDFSIDKAGNIYCTTDPTNLVVLIRPDGKNETLLTDKDGLDGPTDTVLSRDGNDLYITNASFPFFPTSRQRPSLMVYHLNLPETRQ